MDRVDNDQIREPYQDVKGKEKDWFSNSFGHEGYHPILIGYGTFLMFH